MIDWYVGHLEASLSASGFPIDDPNPQEDQGKGKAELI